MQGMVEREYSAHSKLSRGAIQNRIIEWRGKPQIIRVNNGPEYISGKLMVWAEKAGIHIQYIQPGKPQQNAYIEGGMDIDHQGHRGRSHSEMASISSTLSHMVIP